MGVKWKFGEEVSFDDIKSLSDKISELTKSINTIKNDLEGKIQSLNQTITTLTQQVQAQQAYIDQLKPRIGMDAASTNLIAPNGTSKISINNENAYKNVGYGWESLASETWIGNNYYSKSQFNDYSITAKFRELRIGTSTPNTAYIRMYQYNSNQCIIAFLEGNVHNIVAPNDKRIKWDGDKWYFT